MKPSTTTFLFRKVSSIILVTIITIGSAICQYQIYPSINGDNLIEQTFMETSDGGKLILALEFCYSEGGSITIEGCNGPVQVIKTDASNEIEWEQFMPFGAQLSPNPYLFENADGTFTIIYRDGGFQGCNGSLGGGFIPIPQVAIWNFSVDGNLLSESVFPDECGIDIRDVVRLEENQYLITAKFSDIANSADVVEERIFILNKEGEILNQIEYDSERFQDAKLVLKDGGFLLFYVKFNEGLFIDEYDLQLNLLNSSTTPELAPIFADFGFKWQIEYIESTNQFFNFVQSTILILDEDYNSIANRRYYLVDASNFAIDEQDQVLIASTDFTLDTLGDAKITYFNLQGDSIRSLIVEQNRAEHPTSIGLLSNGEFAIAGNIDCCNDNPDGPAKTFFLQESEVDMVGVVDFPQAFNGSFEDTKLIESNGETILYPNNWSSDSPSFDGYVTTDSYEGNNAMFLNSWNQGSNTARFYLGASGLSNNQNNIGNTNLNNAGISIPETPTSLSAFYKFEGAKINDSIVVTTILKKYISDQDSTLIVASGTQRFPPTDVYQELIVPIQRHSQETPDSIIVQIETSTNTNPCDNLKECNFVTVDNLEFQYTPVSTIDTKSSALNIYPNPFSDEIIIDTDTPIESLAVYNNTGQQVYTQNGNGNNLRLNTNQLHSGIYYIVANLTNGKSLRSKVVKMD